MHEEPGAVRPPGRIAFLEIGFRPFFLGASVFAVVALALWLGTLSGAVAIPSPWQRLDWHRHEMLFGLVGAIIAGFLLTAVPNWTGRRPLSGTPLAALAGLWLLARLVQFVPGAPGLGFAAALDAAFPLALALWAGREIRASGNRNLPVAILVALFALAGLGDHARLVGLIALADASYRFGLALVLILISLIGGRIIPAFTRNWLTARAMGAPMPVMFGVFDRLVLVLSALALLAWTLAPAGVASAWLLIGAGVLHAIRLARWAGWRTFAEPLLAALHLAYAWLPAGLLLMGFSILLPLLPPSAALHALTAGAIGAMTLAVMTRATLGHSGRPLHAGPGTVLIYACVHLGALVRVLAPLWPDAAAPLLMLAGLLWGGAWLLFAFIYGPMILRPPPAR
ncbi:MAG: NnrS family protein [Alphaproteobacteria bacterium]|nr:MAG: NnrS family protein [Alphaproteobacteria bacterium]